MHRLAFLCVVFVSVAKGDYNPQNAAADDQRFHPEQLQALKSRSVSLELPAWTNGKVPYVMDPGFSKSKIHTDALKNAINELQNKTCIKIVPRTNEPQYLNFKNSGPNGGCNSFVGMGPVQWQPQEINIADWCTSPGTRWFSTVHEIVHALGFIHEQCRPDRDGYVNVNMDNPDAKNVNYQKLPLQQSRILTKYDYESIMHYPATPNLLTPKDPKIAIGQRDHLSPCDIAKINRYYNCPAQYKQDCPKA
jgi:hypothetical protein